MSRPALPTPETAPLHPTVYPPAEDSYLVLDALSSDVSFLHSRFSTGPSPLLVEVGPGSGIISSFLTSNAYTLTSRSDTHLLAIDANPYACTTTFSTLSLVPPPSRQALFLDVLVGDLCSSLRLNQIDMLVFNPPYVPSSEVPSMNPPKSGENKREEESRLLALTYAGGSEGVEVLAKVLCELDELLTERGVAYMLLCRQNKPEGIVEGLRVREWNVECVIESGKQAGWEKLGVWRIWKEGE